MMNQVAGTINANNVGEAIDAAVKLAIAKEKAFVDPSVDVKEYTVILHAFTDATAGLPAWVHYAILKAVSESLK